MTIHTEAASRIEAYRQRNALIRNDWCEGERNANGYERACLLVAMVPGRRERRCVMDRVKRWTIECDSDGTGTIAYDSTDGEYVEHADYAALLARAEKAEARVAELEAAIAAKEPA